MSSTLMKLYYNLPHKVQDLLITCYGVKLHRRRYSSLFFRRLEFLNDSLHWSASDLEEYQNLRLRKLVEHCYYNVPYYTNLFNKLGAIPSDVKSTKDLKILPILTKKQLLQNPASFLSSSPGSKVVSQSTSGSSGTPLQVFSTDIALAYYYAASWRQRMIAGAELRDPHATFNGRMVCDPTRPTKRPFRKNWYSNQTLFSLMHLDKVHRERMAREIINSDYVYLNGYPSTLHFLSLSQSFLLKKPSKLKFILTSSETLSKRQRKDIELGFGAPVLDYYGNAEMVCSLCQYEDGLYYHDSEDSVVELIENREGSSNIVCTGLNNYAMPLLRYDIGDRATEHRGPKLYDRLALKSIDGRDDDVIITPTGRVIGRLDHIFKGIVNIHRGQLIHSDKHHVKILVEPLSGFKEKDKEALLRNASERIPECVIDIELVDEIPLEKNGKLKFVKRIF
ncbi:phenylacetate--CoA ligase family protein [Aliidiomarina indica]|uniref:hypothetical protein n=1 Tax=Aliidiomarina indica TaxID=2749147 RepID=UPI001890314B|nr:hypothetical protein [Aliidiomarina indica]